jgi:hypothetical protein
MPEAEIDGLFGGTEVGEHGVQQFGKIHGARITRGRRKVKKGKELLYQEGHQKLLVARPRALFLPQPVTSSVCSASEQFVQCIVTPFD